MKPMHYILSAALLLQLAACSSPSPEQYFEEAVLNSNMLAGFANNGLARELDQPPVKLVEGTKDKTAPMQRRELIDQKTAYLEKTAAAVNKLGENDDVKDILHASRALYAYVLPVYKNEYAQLAGLYDANAPRAQIDAAEKNIQDKYGSGFLTRYQALITAGKAYAAKHNIKVQWND